MNRFMLNFIKATGFPIAAPYFKWRIRYENRDNQDRNINGAAIIVSNHKSVKDLMLYLFVFPKRSIRFLVAEIIYAKGKAMSQLLNQIGCIKVDRDQRNFGFIGESLEVLENGGVIGIFPEGKLPEGDNMGEFKPSVGYIAAHAPMVPIIPVYTDGNYGIDKRATVVIGEKYYIQRENDNEPSKAEIDIITEQIREKVLSLKKYVE